MRVHKTGRGNRILELALDVGLHTFQLSPATLITLLTHQRTPDSTSGSPEDGHRCSPPQLVESVPGQGYHLTAGALIPRDGDLALWRGMIDTLTNSAETVCKTGYKLGRAVVWIPTRISLPGCTCRRPPNPVTRPPPQKSSHHRLSLSRGVRYPSRTQRFHATSKSSL